MRHPSQSVFAGATAGWMHGVRWELASPIEVILPRCSHARSRPGLTVRRSDLAPGERCIVNHLAATTLHRTLRDLCLFHAPVEALISLDAALRKRLTSREALAVDPAAKAGRRGADRFRRLVNLAEPAESPMETRLRWLLLTAGLPRPQVQVKLGDGVEFIGKADLYYPASRLIIEYDGANHRDRLVGDDRRQNKLMSAGYRLLRFTASDLSSQPEVVVAQVRGSIST